MSKTVRKGLYRVFTRTWWRYNKAYPGGKEPHMGRKTTIRWANTYEEAQDICRVWNANHKPGPLSRKAEFERVR